MQSEQPQEELLHAATSERRSKRFKRNNIVNVCIFCGAECKTVKQNKIHTLFRICEKKMAQKLLNAAKLFQDHVYTETAAMHNAEDVFAADIQYHAYCCKSYFNRYNAKIEEILDNLVLEESIIAGDDSFKARFLALGLDFQKSAHSLTSIRDQLNEGSTGIVTNRAVKQLIIELYGDAVCFTYPTNKRLSQMVLGTNSSPGALVECLRISPVQQVATQLSQEISEYSFELQKSFCEPEDLQLSMDMFSKNQPPIWEEFCSNFFKGKAMTQLKTDVVFRILHYNLTGGKEPTPFHIKVAEGVHSLTRSKQLVTALNHHGICVSYNTVKRFDVDLAERIITTAGNNRVPLPSVLEATSPLNGALDNFDRNESTLAGTGSTHDTILVLFQNVPLNLEKPSTVREMSERPLAAQSRTTVKLRSKVSCQQLIRMGEIKERGEIPMNYKVSEILSNLTMGLGAVATVADPSPASAAAIESTSIATDAMHSATPHMTTEPGSMVAKTAPNKASSITEAAEFLEISTDPSPTLSDVPTITNSIGSSKTITSDYFLCIVNRFSKRGKHKSDNVPGFTAVRSATVNCNFHPTTKVVTPILPYPATTYDAILTTMINFQDALKQKGDSYGGLWADEGVYHIAKEIQLLKPEQFKNIFLGLGGFHMEKIILACLGTYLEPSGIFGVLVETECYGTDVIKTVISGSHYSRARTAHSMIHEVLMIMMLEAFLSKYPAK